MADNKKKKVEPFVTSDVNEYLDRRWAFEDSLNAHNESVNSLMTSRNWESAIREYNQLLENNSNPAEREALRAYNLFSSGRPRYKGEFTQKNLTPSEVKDIADGFRNKYTRSYYELKYGDLAIDSYYGARRVYNEMKPSNFVWRGDQFYGPFIYLDKGATARAANDHRIPLEKDLRDELKWAADNGQTFSGNIPYILNRRSGELSYTGSRQMAHALTGNLFPMYKKPEQEIEYKDPNNPNAGNEVFAQNTRLKGILGDQKSSPKQEVRYEPRQDMSLMKSRPLESNQSMDIASTPSNIYRISGPDRGKGLYKENYTGARENVWRRATNQPLKYAEGGAIQGKSPYLYPERKSMTKHVADTQNILEYSDQLGRSLQEAFGIPIVEQANYNKYFEGRTKMRVVPPTGQEGEPAIPRSTALRTLKHGGEVNTLEGDIYSKILMNRNKNKDFVNRAFAVGEYPESNMFNVPSKKFGSKSSHMMGWGEDDSGQAYMFPTILNPSNESIKIPNQYADYISNTGYKNATGMNKFQHGGEVHEGEKDIITNFLYQTIPKEKRTGKELYKNLNPKNAGIGSYFQIKDGVANRDSMDSASEEAFRFYTGVQKGEGVFFPENSDGSRGVNIPEFKEKLFEHVDHRSRGDDSTAVYSKKGIPVSEFDLEFPNPSYVKKNWDEVKTKAEQMYKDRNFPTASSLGRFYAGIDTVSTPGQRKLFVRDEYDLGDDSFYGVGGKFLDEHNNPFSVRDTFPFTYEKALWGDGYNKSKGPQWVDKKQHGGPVRKYKNGGQVGFEQCYQHIIR